MLSTSGATRRSPRCECERPARRMIPATSNGTTAALPACRRRSCLALRLLPVLVSRLGTFEQRHLKRFQQKAARAERPLAVRCAYAECGSRPNILLSGCKLLTRSGVDPRPRAAGPSPCRRLGPLVGLTNG